VGTWDSYPTDTTTGSFRAAFQHTGDNIVVTIVIDNYGTTNSASITEAKPVMESVIDALSAVSGLTLQAANYAYTSPGGEEYTP
jgi:hypothetical protein